MEVKNYGFKQVFGDSDYILGLIFMCFPVFSSVLFSVITGVGLLLLGISTVIMGFDIRHDNGAISALTIVFGIV